MSAGSATERPVGVRRVSGPRAGRLTWAAVGHLELVIGDCLLVHDGQATWLGEVVVLPQRICEVAPLAALPFLVRRATLADGWPATTHTAGAQLLASLGLPPELTRPARG